MSSSTVLYDAPGPRARALSRTISIVSIVAVLAGVAWILLTLAAPRQGAGGIELPGMFAPSRWDVFSDPAVWRAFGRGVLATLTAAGIGAAIALVLGVLFALGRTARSAWVRVPVSVVLEFFRGMPVLLMMLFILLVASTGALWAVALALGVYNGAIIGEALRAGIAALPKGQAEAGLSLGLRVLQTKLLIEFPQAFRQMLPVIIAQLVVLLKDSSLGYIVGYFELLRTSQSLSDFFGNKYLFSFFVITISIYLVLNLTLSWVARRIAARGDHH